MDALVVYMYHARRTGSSPAASLVIHAMHCSFVDLLVTEWHPAADYSYNQVLLINRGAEVAPSFPSPPVTSVIMLFSLTLLPHTVHTPSIHNVGRQGSSMAGHFMKQELSPGIQSVQYIFTVSLADLDRDGWPGNGSVQPLRVRRSLPLSGGCDTHSPTPPPTPLSHQT